MFMADDGTLRVGITQPVRASHPGELADMTEVMVLSQIFETPFHRTRDGGAEPHLFLDPPRVEERGDGVHHRLRLRLHRQLLQ